MLSLKYSLYNNLNPKKDLKFIYDINLKMKLKWVLNDYNNENYFPGNNFY